MLKEESTTSETNEQNRQVACIIDDEENSSKISLEKLMSKPIQFALLVIIVFAVIAGVIPLLMVKFTMSIYNDTTLANTHSTTFTNLLIAGVTALYVWFTGNLVTISRKSINLSKESIKKTEESIKLSKESITQNKRSIELSEEAIKQSRKEQQIRDIENRLEKFYIPADDIIKGPLMNNYEKPIMGTTLANYDKLKSLRKYSYLANNITYEAYEKYVTTTCEGCEHFNDCPNKNHKNTIINNSECMYLKVLKDSITEDIKKYNEKLSELKE